MAALAQCSSPRESPATAQANATTLRILVEGTSTNYVSSEETDPHGMVPEIAGRFKRFLGASGENVRFEFVETRDASKLIPELLAGHGDIVANLIMPPEREEPTVDLVPYMTGIREVIAIAPEQRPLASLEDIEGRSVYVARDLPEGSGEGPHFTSLQRLNQQLAKINKPGCNIVALGPNDGERGESYLLRLVDAGSIPATVVYSHVAERMKDRIKKATINSDVAVSQDIVLAWAVRKDSPKLREQLTAFFKSERANTGR